MKKTVEPDTLDERTSVDFSKGVRGKYSNLLAKGTNLVILDPALLPYFPDSESVNRALHAFLAIGDSVQGAIPSRRRTRKTTTGFDPRTGKGMHVPASR